MFQVFAFFYWLVAYYFGGPHWRCLLIHFLSDGLRPIRSCHFYWSLPGCRCDFSYWHGIALLLFNPVVFVNYGQIGALLFAFIYSCSLIAYLIVCYIVIILFAVECATIAYDNLKRYNRGSLHRQSIHRCHGRIVVVRFHSRADRTSCSACVGWAPFVSRSRWR